MLAETSGQEPEYNLPDVSQIQYLLDSLAELGQAKIVGGSIVAMDWSDINEWVKATGSKMTVSEKIALKRLSSEYALQYNKSLSNDELEPNIERPNNREVVANKMNSLFAMLRK